jgi:hypothetical protein
MGVIIRSRKIELLKTGRPRRLSCASQEIRAEALAKNSQRLGLCESLVRAAVGDDNELAARPAMR